MKDRREIIVGGQAVIEGVMMRAPNSYAVAVRRPDGTIVSQAERLPKLSERYPVLRVPVLRGSAVLIHSMVLGIRALNFSATVALDEQAGASVGAATGGGAASTVTPLMEGSGDGGRAGERAGAAGAGVAAAGSIVFALIFNIALFIVLPLLLTNAIFIQFGWGDAPRVEPGAAGGADAAWRQVLWAWLGAYLRPVRPSVGFNLLDGVIRMVFFVAMIYIFSRMGDIKRVFEYHGAEHKTVYAWEAGEALTVANARRHPRQHPRCGTSFLMVVMLVSILLFSVIRFDSLLLNLATRIALVPLIAGISYEIIKLAGGRSDTGSFFSLLTRPGIWLQNLTTREPSDEQLEVAIYALNESLKLEPQAAA